MTVLESLNRTGGVGKHFRFSAEEFSDMVGYDKWEFEEFEVVQSGSQSWEGTIQVRKDKNTSYGWKFYEASDGDWKVNDTITLKNCSNPGKIFSFRYQTITYFYQKFRTNISSY